MERLRTTIAEDLTEVNGTCSMCGRSFRVFVRETREHAIRLLRRSFKLHCRLRHGILVKELPAGYEVEQIVNDLGLPAFVFTRDTRKLIAANDRFLQVMEYTEAEAKALRLEDLRAPEDLLLLQSLAQNFGDGSLESRYRTRNGRSLRVHLRYRDLILMRHAEEIGDVCFVVVTRYEAA
jgi:PAS domain-containing protein